MKKKTLEVVKHEYIPNPYNTWEYPKHWYSKLPKPTALASGFWDKWEADMKDRYPIRYFIQETLPEFFDINILTKIKNIKWYILYRISPKHRYHVVRTGRKPGYCDPDIQMIHCAFELLKEFVNFNIEKQIVNWDADEWHKEAWNEMMSLNTWWVYERPEREDKFDREHTWPKIDRLGLFDKEKQDDPNVIEYRRILNLYNDAKERWHQEDEDMFIRLIKIRRYLWYP